jgi:spore coat polysaccharide biosynthesis protein SpsF
VGADLKPLQAWAGEFGDAYTERNILSDEAVRGRARMWSQIWDRMQPDAPQRVLEVGANIGLNLRALQAITDAELWGQEPNPSALERLREVLPEGRALEGFAHEIPLADGAVDLVMTMAVLIHVHPSLLERTMDELYRVSGRYIAVAEFFAQGQEAVTWRGEEGLLHRNDYGGLMMDRFPDLQLIDYGFWWRRVTSGGDCTWWLFRKRHG